MRHRKLHVPTHHLRVRLRALLADTHSIEGTDYGVGYAVLLPSSLGEILTSELLETIGAFGRRASQQVRLLGRKGVATLVDHGAADDHNLLEETSLVSLDASVERGASDALIFCQEEVCKLVEHGDASDDGSGCHKDFDLVVEDHAMQQLEILGVATKEMEARVAVETATQIPVFPEVVDAIDLMALLQQHRDRIAHDEAVRTSHQDSPRLVRIGRPGRRWRARAAIA
mmetsp:Transcript_44068/g.93807  ORF Transcript_44068/g.93807 Transcript_44068/m.93807 type:complete len:228 (-) Transcript_44068:79-762(-)